MYVFRLSKIFQHPFSNIYVNTTPHKSFSIYIRYSMPSDSMVGVLNNNFRESIHSCRIILFNSPHSPLTITYYMFLYVTNVTNPNLP